MSLKIALINTRIKLSASRFERATMNPAKSQKEKLFSIIRKNENTEYGRRYNFPSILTVSDYQKQVPVIKYEDIIDDIERVYAGEKNILTAEMPILFSRTSGTTGKPKYIPVTPTCKKHSHREATMTLVYHTTLANPGICNGPMLSLVSPAVEGYTEHGIPIGSTTGVIYRDMPTTISRNYAIPYEVFEIKNYQAKYYAIMRIAMELDISSISTANPSSVLKICEKGNEFSEHIIKDIRDGTLSEDFEIETEIRKNLKKRFKPNENRSRFLEQIKTEHNGILKPADYWPNICMIACWKSGAVGHYIKKFPHWFDMDKEPQLRIWDLGYLATEARCTIPVSKEDNACALTVSTNFYEFADIGDVMANPETPSLWTFLTAEQLENGKEYYIFVTTTGGLYRYNINDIVKVKGYYNKTPKIIFRRKGQGVTNITGEKLSVNQVIEAMQYATEKTGICDPYFIVEADIENSRYILKAELSGNITEEKGRDLTTSFDDYLKLTNIEYKSKRDSMRLAIPALHVMRHGWYDRRQEQLVDSGKKTFQIKPQILSLANSSSKELSSEIRQIIEIEKTEQD